jgi:hypothetical protein
METWSRWEPIKNLSGRYYINSFLLSEESDLVIKLSDEHNLQKIEIRFDGAIDAYRYTNESFYFKTFGELTEKYSEDFYSNWSFFKVANSEYLTWLSEKSCTFSNEFPFIHFCIFGGDEVIDILARYEPKVKIIE